MAIYLSEMAYSLLAILLLCSCVDVVQGIDQGSTTHTIIWTRDGVQQYTPSNPLQVSLGDSIAFRCINGSSSNMWRQSTVEQYDQCDCSAAAMDNANDDDCTGNMLSRYFECFGRARNIIVQIVSNSDTLGSARDFTPGTTYYFISYSDGQMLLDAASDRGSGGECKETEDGQPGLRMVVFVQDIAVTDPSEATPETETDKTDKESLSPDPNVDVPGDTTGNTKYIPGGNELESGSGNIDLGLGAGLTDSADSFTACSTLLLLVCVTLVTLLG